MRSLLTVIARLITALNSLWLAFRMDESDIAALGYRLDPSEDSYKEEWD